VKARGHVLDTSVIDCLRAIPASAWPRQFEHGRQQGGAGDSRRSGPAPSVGEPSGLGGGRARVSGQPPDLYAVAPGGDGPAGDRRGRVRAGSSGPRIGWAPAPARTAVPIGEGSIGGGAVQGRRRGVGNGAGARRRAR